MLTTIQLASDLHVGEYLAEGLEIPFRIHPQTNLLILAGDIDIGLQGMDFARALDVPTLYVPGVLEHAGLEPEVAAPLMKLDSSRTKVRVLQNDAVVINGIRFLGTTLWPNFGAPRPPGEPERVGIEVAMSGYGSLQDNGKPMTYAGLWARHQAAAAWLSQRLAEPFNGPTVVISHHIPHPKSIPQQGAGDPFAAASQTRLTGLMKFADYWLHGSAHVACDYRIRDCRVICNPVGAPSDHRHPYSVAQGSNRYDPELLIRISGA